MTANDWLLKAIHDSKLSGVCAALRAGAKNYVEALQQSRKKTPKLALDIAMCIMNAASNRERGNVSMPLKLGVNVSDLDADTVLYLIFAARLNRWTTFLDQPGIDRRVLLCNRLIDEARADMADREPSPGFIEKCRGQTAAVLVALLLVLIEEERWYRVQDVARSIAPADREQVYRQVIAHVPCVERRDMFGMVLLDLDPQE